VKLPTKTGTIERVWVATVQPPDRQVPVFASNDRKAAARKSQSVELQEISSTFDATQSL